MQIDKCLCMKASFILADNANIGANIRLNAGAGMAQPAGGQVPGQETGRKFEDAMSEMMAPQAAPPSNGMTARQAETASQPAADPKDVQQQNLLQSAALPPDGQISSKSSSGQVSLNGENEISPEAHASSEDQKMDDQKITAGGLTAPDGQITEGGPQTALDSPKIKTAAGQIMPDNETGPAGQTDQNGQTGQDGQTGPCGQVSPHSGKTPASFAEAAASRKKSATPQPNTPPIAPVSGPKIKITGSADSRAGATGPQAQGGSGATAVAGAPALDAALSGKTGEGNISGKRSIGEAGRGKESPDSHVEGRHDDKQAGIALTAAAASVSSADISHPVEKADPGEAAGGFTAAARPPDVLSVKKAGGFAPAGEGDAPQADSNAGKAKTQPAASPAPQPSIGDKKFAGNLMPPQGEQGPVSMPAGHAADNAGTGVMAAHGRDFRADGDFPADRTLQAGQTGIQPGRADSQPGLDRGQGQQIMRIRGQGQQDAQTGRDAGAQGQPAVQTDPSDKSTGRSASRFSNQFAGQPAGQSAGKSAYQSFGQSAGQPADSRLPGRPEGHASGQRALRPDQPGFQTQTMNQLASQPGNQSASQPGASTQPAGVHIGLQSVAGLYGDAKGQQGQPSEPAAQAGNGPQKTIADAPFVVTKQDAKTIEVRIEPEGLGKMDIKLFIDRGHVNAHINASEPVGKEFLEGNLRNIVSKLAGDGISVGSFSVSLRNRKREGWEGRGKSEGPSAVEKTGPAQLQGQPGLNAPAGQEGNRGAGIISLFA